MGKLDVNKKIKRDSLLDTAFQLFMTQGINKTSISDIVNQAGVAKGTFYLYFKDKYDIHNKLISHKSSQLFQKAVEEYQTLDMPIDKFEDRMIFFIDSIINQLIKNPNLLKFISKNLSWGIFKNALSSPAYEDDINFTDVFHQILQEAPEKYRDPEIMLFMIVELVSSTCYSVILYNEPVGMDKMKPYLYQGVRNIIHIYQLEDCTENN